MKKDDEMQTFADERLYLTTVLSASAQRAEAHIEYRARDKLTR